jgi:hypothetical protein
MLDDFIQPCIALSFNLCIALQLVQAACPFTQASAFLDPSQPVFFYKPFAPFAGHVAQNRRVVPQICLCPKVWRLRGASSPVSSKACGAVYLSMRRPAAAMSLTF